MSTMDGSESRGVDIAMPCAVMIVMLGVCLLLAQIYRKRRRDRQREVQRQEISEEASVATCWSTIGLYNGVHGDIDDQSQNSVTGYNDGERMHLLEHNSGTLYT